VQTSTPTASNASSSACPPEGALFLPTGWTFNALLPQAVYSYDLSVPVLAVLEDDVKFLDRLVLPRKTRLVGTASTTHSFDRVNINFTLVVLPEGCEFPISAIALSDKDGSAGVPGTRETHEDAVGAHIALQSMLTATGAAATAVVPGGSVEGLLATNFTGEANQQVGQSLNQVKSLDSINVRERTAIRVFVLRRFLRPAEGR
jgi:type IV secretory pathway VirB10-like protein